MGYSGSELGRGSRAAARRRVGMSPRSRVRLKRRIHWTLSTLLLVVLASDQMTAQTPEPGRPRFYGGLAGALAQPRGEFADYVEVGGGLHGFVRVGLDPRSIVAVRLHGGFVTYGNETKRVCLSATVGCRVQVDLTTSNNIFLLGLGPDLTLPLGPARIYGNVSAGLSYFSTDSSVEGSSDAEPFASTENYGDGGFAWTAGAGVEVQVAEVDGTPIAIDLGLGYQKNGRREYLTEGGITDRPDGSLVLDVKRSRADFLLWRLGVSIGIRSDDEPEP